MPNGYAPGSSISFAEASLKKKPAAFRDLRECGPREDFFGGLRCEGRQGYLQLRNPRERGRSRVHVEAE